MTEDLVKFPLPADFVAAHVALQPSELAYGHARGWLTDQAVVRVAEIALAEGGALSPQVGELACLLSDEYSRVGDLVSQISEDPTEEPSTVWFYLALEWLYAHRDDYADPLEMVEMLSADFEFPADARALLRFTPVQPGAPMGLDAMEHRWRDYLRAKSREFAARRL